MPLFWRKIESRLVMPALIDDLVEVIGADEADWYVTCGFRSIADSDAGYTKYKAYLEGLGPPAPKFAPGGKSAHNFGLAVDIALDGDATQPRLQPQWNEQHPAWIRLRGKVDAHPRLHGGWWFGDGDHIEKTHWESFKGWRP